MTPPRWISPPGFRPRELGAHKSRCGHVLVIGGSCGLSGAPRLAAGGALAVGAGLVTVAVPRKVRAEVAGHDPALMVRSLPATTTGHLAWTGLAELEELAAERDVVVLGPGAGRHPATLALLRRLVKELPVPTVVDADALTSLVGLDSSAASRETRAPRVYTPHPGEASRLLALEPGGVPDDREGVAERLRCLLGDVVVLKGRGTLVCNGEEMLVNRTGNPGLAVGGSGDILAGVIGGLLAQGADPFRAACDGVYIHGAAADDLREETGERAMTPSALLQQLPRTTATYESRRRP